MVPQVPVVPVVPWVDSGLQVSFGSLCFCRFLWFPVVPIVPGFPQPHCQGMDNDVTTSLVANHNMGKCLQSKDTQPIAGLMGWQM